MIAVYNYRKTGEYKNEYEIDLQNIYAWMLNVNIFLTKGTVTTANAQRMARFLFCLFYFFKFPSGK